MHGIIYRRGSRTSDNLTPRPVKDTVARPGKAPGLSAFDTLASAAQTGDKAQGIDVGRLHPPLAAIPDDPGRGGTPGHVSVCPVDAAGNVDQQKLDDWAASRGTGQTHPLTQDVLDAIVNPDVRRQP
jgi:hypothetical protein